MGHISENLKILPPVATNSTWRKKIILFYVPTMNFSLPYINIHVYCWFFLGRQNTTKQMNWPKFLNWLWDLWTLSDTLDGTNWPQQQGGWIFLLRKDVRAKAQKLTKVCAVFMVVKFISSLLDGGDLALNSAGVGQFSGQYSMDE